MGTYHVVCHDCPEEGVYDSRSEAVTARNAHETDTGHRLSLEDITRAVTNP